MLLNKYNTGRIWPFEYGQRPKQVDALDWPNWTRCIVTVLLYFVPSRQVELRLESFGLKPVLESQPTGLSSGSSMGANPAGSKNQKL